MTTIVLLADPPREGVVLPDLPDSSPLSASEATELYEAMLKDSLVIADDSGGELLVNYRPDDQLPDSGRSSEAEMRALANDVLSDLDDVRFEVQVGSSVSARVGNTATHLLEREGVDSVVVLTPNAPTLTRTVVDSASMKLRRSEVVIGPATDGRTYYLGLTDPIDFEGAYEPPAVETLTNRAVDAGHDVDFLQRQPVVEIGADLRTLIPDLNARIAAERVVPVHTATALNDLGLRVEERADGPRLVR
jgi:glycosyltransferase A (GT-A) superfamily protein (DUF2064 family)